MTSPMTPPIPQVKICGITDEPAMQAACDNGARFVGLVFHPGSPRYLTLDIAAQLARKVPTAVRSVGLFVDPEDETLMDVLSTVQIDMIQLHGNENRTRAAEIRQKFALPVMKAIRLKTREDLRQIADFRPVSDWLLFDAGAGDGKTFDWSLLDGYDDPTGRWMLAGGLTPDNVGNAIQSLAPPVLDVSSGVESVRGQKDPHKIKYFLEEVKNL